MCPVRCPIEAEVQDGRCRFVQGNRRDAVDPRRAVHARRGRDRLRGRRRTAAVPHAAHGRPRRRPLAADLLGAGAGDGGRADGGRARGRRRPRPALARRRRPVRRPAAGLRARAWAPPTILSRRLPSHAIHRAHAALSLFGFTDDRLVPDFLKRAREVVLQGRNLFETVDVAQANDAAGRPAERRPPDRRRRARHGHGRQGRPLFPDPAGHRLRPQPRGHPHAARAQGSTTPPSPERWIAGPGRAAPPGRPVHARPSPRPRPASRPSGHRGARGRPWPRPPREVVWHPGPQLSRQADSFFVCRSAFIINALLGYDRRQGRPAARRPAGGRRASRRCTRWPTSSRPSTHRARTVSASIPGVRGRSRAAARGAARHRRRGDPYPVTACIVYEQDPLAELPNPPAVQGRSRPALIS
ncbi:MAG: hypothetical protein MZU95_02355 [Desulfomicrobium escambiense]|nr:hypothetical protein [Desulfomicrobium escambiense]